MLVIVVVQFRVTIQLVRRLVVLMVVMVMLVSGTIETFLRVLICAAICMMMMMIMIMDNLLVVMLMANANSWLTNMNRLASVLAVVHGRCRRMELGTLVVASVRLVMALGRFLSAQLMRMGAVRKRRMSVELRHGTRVNWTLLVVASQSATG